MIIMLTFDLLKVATDLIQLFTMITNSKHFAYTIHTCTSLIFTFNIYRRLNVQILIQTHAANVESGQPIMEYIIVNTDKV